MYCKYCNRVDLPQDAFYFDKASNRYKRTCKNCTAVRRALHRDKYNRRRRQYYAENKAKLQAEARKYYEENPAYREKRLKQFSDYYLSNKTGKSFTGVTSQSRPSLLENVDLSAYQDLLGLSSSEKSQNVSNSPQCEE